MRLLLLSVCIIISCGLSAKTYYFSNAGVDFNDGLSQATPFKTITKLNALFPSFIAGDKILFRSGDTFYGSIAVSAGGNASSPIILSSYGSGPKPVITGLSAISSWVNIGANIWESSSAISSLKYTNMVVVNGINTPMGKYPNTGYFLYSNPTTNPSTISSNSLNSAVTNWTGAELVAYNTTYTILRDPITAQSGSKITYAPKSSDIGFQNSPGYLIPNFFIQNDPRTLDAQNEWYYNPSTKKIRFFSYSSPSNVQVSTVDTLLKVVNYANDYITIDGLSFTGSNNSSIEIHYSQNITVQNCDFNFSGVFGVHADYGTHQNALIIQNCTFNNSNNSAINLSSDCSNAIVKNNNVKNTGTNAGMMSNSVGAAIAIDAEGDNTNISYNSVDSTGYNGIQFNGNNTSVNHNFIAHFCYNFIDGGGIYTSNNYSNSTQTGVKIFNNIIIYAFGKNEGIYLDDKTNNTEVYNNSIAYCQRNIYLHNNWNINVHNNNCFSSSYTSIASSNDDNSITAKGLIFKNNTFLAKTPGEKVGCFNTLRSQSMDAPFTSDSNYWAKPVNDNIIFETLYSGVYTERNLAGWQSLNNQDSHSKKSPKAITDTNDLRFEYNATSSSITVNLGANYMDVTGKAYNGTIILNPYSSAILIKNGALINIPPVANAGQDQTITLPVNSLTLSGSGTDSDGTITGYSWTKVSGPPSDSIFNATSVTTQISKLTAGIYLFALKVTDNNGASSSDTMKVTVNAAPNQLPVANAGNDSTIYLPANTLTLYGSGDDPDGTIVKYSWTKISGPSGYIIQNPSSATTKVTGLVQGVYQFQLSVMDNDSAKGNDIIIVTVNPAPNKAPTAFAGNDQIITLPLNTVSLSGSGNDIDGVIVSYAWTKISGPNTYNIVNASSASTSVNNLISGTYQFELDVTDNDGAVGKDVIQIIVNEPANIPPVANAGADQSITLPSNSVTLSGSGSDADGNVTGYVWTKISGPSGFNIVNNNASVTSVTNLTQGVYQFQLSVTDNQGAIATDVVEITVTSQRNISPVANAGADQSINLPMDSVTLSGSGNDSDGTIISYKWTLLSGPSAVTITDQASPVTLITGLAEGVYQFELAVADNDSATGTSIVQVVVNGSVNEPPKANAGIDQSITLPDNSINLTGIGNDTNGIVTNYSWTKISGPDNYNFENSDSALTMVNGLVAGTYQFQLQVTDNNGATATDIMQVIVNGISNMPPTANAGANQEITLPDNSVTLSGVGNDSDGIVTSYSWTKISGPKNYSITDSNAATINVTRLAQGVYQFELQVTDNDGASGTSIIQVTVNAMLNQPPVANAGADQAITLPQNNITVSGNGTDADGTIIMYSWSEISGPVSYTIVDPSSAVTAINNLVQGVYNFELQVTDNSGAITNDTMQVIVNAPANIPPACNAGTDQTITLPQNSITLNGNATDADGTVVSYVWTKISGPSSYIISNASSANTNVNNLVQGAYKFELKAADNKGGIGKDTVVITVNAAGNISPTAAAGADQVITLPSNSVILSGSGSDPDGTVTAYLWTKISGPSAYTINNASSATTNVTGLVQGIYEFQLSVTDNKGATSTDVVEITVSAVPNQSPTVSAGQDHTITLPSNSVTAIGIGSDADGTIVSYLWTKISGPSSYTISSPSSAVTSIGSLTKGTYTFMLKVTDNDGATATAVMKVIVDAAPNQPPVASAGQDKTITLPTNSIALSGTGTDADGNVISYSWIKISGPSSYNIVNASLANTNVTMLSEGVYQFQLKVKDNDGAIGTDNIQVTVNKAPNKAPTANAGADKSINLPTDSAIINGIGNDADGTISSYLWTKVSGPSSYLFTDSTSALMNVTDLVQGLYQFQLTVTDNDGAIATDIVQITINPAPNQAPDANAGPYQSITLPANNIIVNGTGTDIDGTVVNYLWTKISGPSAYLIVSPSSSSTSINNLVEGTYQFQLKVTDNEGATSTDILQVTVKAAPNKAPVAKAGSDQTITLPVNSVALSGSGTDADGTVTSYLWTKISGPSSYTFSNALSANTNITGLVQGVYQFQISVTDNDGATSTDVVQVTVNAAPNQPPVANAGTDQSITLPANSVLLNGSGTDADGTIASYSWTKISGPSSYSFNNTSSASTNVTGLVEGVYQFELKVTDDNGATNTDIIQIIVNAATNLSPVADAGQDQTITLPINFIHTSGSGVDKDGTIINYSWSEVSGPDNFNIVNAASANTDITGLTQGTYQFELKVTDNNGASGKDTIIVIVNAAANIPPTVNAGADQRIYLPESSATLAGTANDADGSIINYSWTEISGPSPCGIVNAASPVTDIWNLNSGVYSFELKATDNNGAVARDTVQITVVATNNPPTADAGNDQTITLPQNSVTLKGSGTDADGFITGYSWVEIAGPSSAIIVSPDSAATSIDSLVGGNYLFELTVTDNNGNIGKDTVIISVAEPRLNVSSQNVEVKAYPNPFTTTVTLEVNAPPANAALNFVITTAEGKIVKMGTLASQSSLITKQIDFTNFANDVYMVSIYNNNKIVKSLQIIKM